MSAPPTAIPTTTSSATNATATSALQYPGLAGPTSGTHLSLDEIICRKIAEESLQPGPVDREHLHNQVQMALSLVPPAPETDRAGVLVLRAAADFYSREQLYPDRAAICLSFADRFAKNPNDDEAFLDFGKECGEWLGLPNQQFHAILGEKQYQHIYDILHPQRVRTPESEPVTPLPLEDVVQETMRLATQED